MENESQSSIFNDFTIDEDLKTNFNDVAKWAKINAIVGFISAGITLLTMVATLISMFGYAFGGSNTFSNTVSIAISLLLNVLLFKAAKNINDGIGANNQQQFNDGLSKLAKYFRVLGIIIIVVLAICVFAVLVSIVVSVNKAF
jgi:ABC-type Fe3+ transport system permease subunit